MRVWTLFALAPLLLRGQIDPAALLRQARARIVEDLARLPKYTCVQTINRAHFALYYARMKSCGEPVKPTGPNGPKLLLAWTDRFKLDVTVSEGAEIFSWAGAREFQSSDARQIVGGGLTGSGDFGPFLMDIFGGDAPQSEYKGLDRTQGQPLAAYRYHVPASASHYQLQTGSRPSDKATLAFEGEFWIDPQTADLRRLTIVVPQPPPHAATCRIETEIGYQPATLGPSRLLLPQSTLLKLWDADGSRYENRIAYAGCRAFQSESVFRPEVEGTAADAAPSRPAAQHALTLPPGLDLHIDLTTPIDMESASGGDAISGQLEEEIRGPGGVLAPAGAVVHGRVVRAERHFQPSSFFTLGLRFDSLTISGPTGSMEVPLVLDAILHSAEEKMLMGSFERAQGIGLYLFHGDPRVLAEGFVSEWRTSARPVAH